MGNFAYLLANTPPADYIFFCDQDDVWLPQKLELTLKKFRQYEENGYSVISVRTGKETCTAVGILPPLTSGEQVLLTGTWVDHPQYGRQFKVESYEKVLPAEEDDILRYLASGAIKGNVPRTAQRRPRQKAKKAGLVEKRGKQGHRKKQH